MAIKFKRGETVKQITPIVQGTVTETRVIGDELMVFVEYTDAAGEKHERAFSEDELEAVTAEAAAQ